MKKIYEKPNICFESFALSANIASDCEIKTNIPSNDKCGMSFSGLNVFLDTMLTGCENIQIISEGGDGQFNQICYHVPQGDNLFNS